MNYIMLIIALTGIAFGADALVSGSVTIARRFRVSDFVIGAAIVGVGTSMPELVVSFLGALKGNSDVAIGNIVGSNIFNILGILGLTALLFPIRIDKANMKFEIPCCILVSILLTLLAFNFFNKSVPTIGRLDGLILLLIFGAYMAYSIYRDRSLSPVEPQHPAEPAHVPESPLFKAVIMVLIGLIMLITSCDLFVETAVIVAKAFGVNDAFISLTLIACGTSLPELAASITAAIRKNPQIALGNIIGSNIFNITWILGISPQIMPLTSSGIALSDYIIMVIASILPFIFGLRGKIGRGAGALMLAAFILYTIFLASHA